MSKTICNKCGCTVFEASKRGAYLKRCNPKGEDPIWICSPSCEGKHGDWKSAAVRAIEDD